jgi:hypothetical protein
MDEITQQITQQGVPIQPIVYPINQGTATRLSVLVLNFPTDALTCTTYWQLLTDEGLQLSQGNYNLTEEEFAAWGQDNNYVNQCVANAINVTLI